MDVALLRLLRDAVRLSVLFVRRLVVGANVVHGQERRELVLLHAAYAKADTPSDTSSYPQTYSATYG